MPIITKYISIHFLVSKFKMHNRRNSCDIDQAEQTENRTKDREHDRCEVEEHV